MRTMDLENTERRRPAPLLVVFDTNPFEDSVNLPSSGQSLYVASTRTSESPRDYLLLCFCCASVEELQRNEGR